jgi:hypothetical protein
MKLDTYEQRAAVVGRGAVEVDGKLVTITLNGKQAEIYGSKMPFPRVSQLGTHGTVSDAEFAWGTIAHVLTREDNPGAFKT